MELDKEPAEALLAATETKQFGRAPRAVVDAAASLLDGAAPDFAFPEASSEDGQVVWRLAMLQGGLFHWVEAARKGTMWSFERGYNGEEDATTLTAWARPLSRISEVRVGQIHRHDDRVTGTWRWAAGYEIEFDDGKLIEFSVFSSRDGEPFVAEVLRRMRGE